MKMYDREEEEALDREHRAYLRDRVLAARIEVYAEDDEWIWSATSATGRKLGFGRLADFDDDAICRAAEESGVGVTELTVIERPPQAAQRSLAA